MRMLILLLIFGPLLLSTIGFLSRKSDSLFSILGAGISFLVAVILLVGESGVITVIEWLPKIEIYFVLDGTSRILITLVTLIALLVQSFSAWYMKTDPGKKRYFLKLSFFTSAMIGLLLAGDLLSLFLFWELVGFASYLLIGFWYQKDQVSKSARTAFMVNRVADAFLLTGIILVSTEQGIVSFSDLSGISFLPSIFLILGAFGKSAQLPFSGWLVKAMAGPTPVSALIHAATMVAAGVYLLVRVAPVIDETSLTYLAIIGSCTAFYGAICALVQYDLKAILAYSTISQLGYMVMGVGVGAAQASLFHLLTHAFFKAGLFLAAAVIIKHMGASISDNPQDIRNMGGLRRQLPWVFTTVIIFGAALVGVPFFSGFMSKEALLMGSFSWAKEQQSIFWIVPILALITVLLTAFYVFRMIAITFLGSPQQSLITAQKLKFPTWVLVSLAVGSFGFIYNLNPFSHQPIFQSLLVPFEYQLINVSWNLTGISLVLIALGLLLAYFKFIRPSVNRVAAATWEQSNSRNFVESGLGLNQAYVAFGSITYAFGKFGRLIDQRIFDPILHFIAVGAVVFSKTMALVDRFVVDGFVTFCSGMFQFIGKRLASLNARDLQSQLIWLAVGIILILTSFILF